MDEYMNNRTSKISKLYKSLSYSDLYGTKVLIVIILFVVLFVAYSYFNTLYNHQPIRDDWTNRRCDASVIPMAGIINKPSDRSVLQYTKDNLDYCVTNILKAAVPKAMQPLESMFSSLLTIYTFLSKRINSIRHMVSYIRSKIALIVKNVYQRLLQIVIPIQEVVIKTKDLMGKITAIMEVGLNTAMGNFYTLKALMGIIISNAANVLVILAFVMVALFAMAAAAVFFYPWMLYYILGMIGSITTSYIVITTMLVLIITFSRASLGISPRVTLFDMPKRKPLPKCFDGDTMIRLENNTTKPIKDVNVGDRLADSGIVTAKLTLSASDEKMFMVNNVIVSGSHRVRYKHRWILVSDHPDANVLFDYNKPVIYCLNTTSKHILVNDTKFIDWDEIDADIEKGLREEVVEKFNVNAEPGDLGFIHSYFDGGFDGKVVVNMDGVVRDKEISQVCIGDKLRNGVVVYGIVEVERSMIRNRANIYNGLHKPDNLEKSSTLRHLLTTAGYFIVDNQRVGDYNKYIDKPE